MAVSLESASTRMRFDLSFPVLMKEMRVRMRGLRAPILLGVTTALAIFIGLCIIIPSWDSFSGGIDMRWSMVSIGKNLFNGLTILECILCGLIAPALTAGAISLEREQQTLDLLLLTRLSNLNILLGKLLSALSFVGMVLICSLPVISISFLLGGVAPGQLLWSAAIIFATAVLFSTIGLHCSTHFPKTSTAVAVAYCACLALLTLIPLVGAMMGPGELLENDLPQAFYTFVTGASAVIAILPALFVSALYILIVRRPVPRWLGFGFWFAFVIACFSMLCLFPHEITQAMKSHQEYFLLANSAAAMGYILGDAHLGPGGWVDSHFIPLSVALLLFWAGVVLMLTIGAFKLLRK